MTYEEKIIEHTEDNGDVWSEATASVEFSAGDLVEMRNILREFRPNLWAKGFLSDIENTLEKMSIY